MTISITHSMVSLKEDGGDTSLVRASDWNDDHVLPANIEEMLEAWLLVWDNIILIWDSTVASIPAGFQLCNGTNGTPDMRDKFIVGAKQDDAGVAKTNVTGSLTAIGAPTHAHNGPWHAHGGIDHLHGIALNTAEGGADHYHAVSGWTGNNNIAVHRDTAGSGDNTAANLHTHYLSLSTGGASVVAHAHYISGSTGAADRSLQTNGNGDQATSSAAAIPTYYSKCFIKWVGV